MEQKIEYTADIKMLREIVDKLNEKYDTQSVYPQLKTGGNKMFRAEYQTDGTSGENWCIAFMGFPVLFGESSDENYICLEETNRRKIALLADANTICTIRNLITIFANSGASLKNKNEWLSIMKKGIEADESI